MPFSGALSSSGTENVSETTFLTPRLDHMNTPNGVKLTKILKYFVVFLLFAETTFKNIRKNCMSGNTE